MTYEYRSGTTEKLKIDIQISFYIETPNWTLVRFIEDMRIILSIFSLPYVRVSSFPLTTGIYIMQNTMVIGGWGEWPAGKKNKS